MDSLFQDNGSAAFDALLNIASSGLTSDQRVALMKALNQAESKPVQTVDGEALSDASQDSQPAADQPDQHVHDAGEDAN